MNPTGRIVSAAILLMTVALRPASADAGDGPSPLRWNRDAGAVEVVGLSPKQIQEWRSLVSRSEPRVELLSVRLDRAPDRPEAALIVGRFEYGSTSIRFKPTYSFDAGIRYRARYYPERLSGGIATRPPIELVFMIPKPPLGPPTSIQAVYPTLDLVPENLLKVYLHFSAPMTRGEAYRRVRVVDASGKPVERAFLEIGEELWNREMTRLTLLFDPGRIKRGLKPREEEGPIFEEGKTYSLVIDRDWPDASGQVLAEGFRKSFQAGPPDPQQADPNLWSVKRPKPGTREPLVVRFPEPLDHAMLLRAIVVLTAGRPLPGRIDVDSSSTVWRFTPDSTWAGDRIELKVDTELEDRAGNSIARPFEVDETRPIPDAERYRLIPVPDR